ncbi:uncharacterized protein [Diadema antillarum]|uniref:uncharacterized protein n=1 Tax=Diadema antillarum TaxID=105358 RepID=UPI003A8962B2
MDTPCPKGFYCPTGTEYSTQYACPAGTYNNRTRADDIFDCMPCTAGKYCDGDGNDVPTDDCAAGWYCSRGAYSRKPQPSVNDSSLLNASIECPIYSLNNTGDICPPGTYCPVGSDQPLQCPPGQYCEDYANEIPDGDCLAGFFCNGSAVVRDSQPCSPGYYCPEGTTIEQPCPPGTFSPYTQNSNISDCLLCTAGMYCEDYGLASPTAECAAGYFCPGGQNTSQPTHLACSPGHFCQQGSWNETGCPSGYFQPHWKQSDCDICPEGSYCKAFGDYEILDEENITESGNFSGRYRSYRGVAVPTICPGGSYCPEGTEFGTQYLCPEGTFSNQTGLYNNTQCTPCEPGMYCPGEGNTAPYDSCAPGHYCTQSAASATPDDGVTGDICPAGKYCETGSITGVGCPKGTFSNQTGLMAADQCWNCTAGYYCGRTGLTAVSGPCSAGFYCLVSSEEVAPVGKSYGDVCTPGHYCPNGTYAPIPCPAGTFLDSSGAAERDDCIQCSAGYYCETQGKTNVTAQCAEGFYCTRGADTSNPSDGMTGDICPVGHYCELGSVAPVPCPNGTYVNHTGAESCYVCPAGRQCIHGDTADPCPQGYYCPEGTGYNVVACPAGYFGNTTGLAQESECTPCTGGYYCSTPGLGREDGQCSAGYYCEYGVDIAAPSGSQTGVGGVCPEGSYCPEGSVIPKECDAGTYTSSPEQASCAQCLAGYYCPSNTSDPTLFPCPEGYYCPLGTGYSTEYPCPEGTYNGLSIQQTSSSCELCPPGMYCEGEGLPMPSGNCSAGWFCTGGSSSSTPLPPGNASVISDCTCLSVNYTGNRCPPGTYCPSGSSRPIDCHPGFYCDDYELDSPTDQCHPGFYCPGGNDDPTPDGFECLAGHYCERGSAYPTPCANGTFSNTTGNTEAPNCESCTPGYYCAGEHLSTPSGPCAVGYYCPGGQSTKYPVSFICPAGFACPLGSSQPELCPRGFYQSEDEQGSCDFCPEGSYCDPYELNNVTGVIVPQDCITGHYCPNRTEYAEQNKCPPGTYSNKTNLASVGECTPCDAGWYCDEAGLMAPKAQCQAGYFCTLGSSEPAPEDGSTGNICPIGMFCVEGSVTGENCPAGRYGNQTGLREATECPLCDPGYYCPIVGQSSPYEECSAGFYCELGSTRPNPTNTTGYRCPIGHYCPQGTPVPIQCPAGTYNPEDGKDMLSDCVGCDPGSYCQYEGQSNTTGVCIEGYYCSGNASVPNPEDGQTGNICPIGHYCPEGSSYPLPCNNATYMNDTGASECLTCPEGFMCVRGTEPDRCPSGYYCPRGTGYDIQPCPAGTYGDGMGLTEVGDCTQCPGGFYCESPGQGSTTNECDPGFFCTIGVNVRAPNGMNNTGVGGSCYAGHECPQGSAAPTPCLAGFYSGYTQRDSCDVCPAGKYCENATVVPLECPVGHYCPDGTEYSDQFPCPAGTYNNVTGQTNLTDCLYCPPGMYCEGTGLDYPSGLCDEGFYCSGASPSKRPFDVGVLVNNSYVYPMDTCHPEFDCVCPDYINSTGGLCGPGYYCPQGSAKALNCPAGMYCETPGLASPTGNCSAGYYCNHTSFEPDQYICPAGYYCPEGTGVPFACPAGSYSYTEGNVELGNCLNCTAGQYCAGEGNALPDDDCDPGYYCPGGQTSANPVGLECPAGFYCPGGSHDPILCENGTYQANTREAACDICPGSYYCDPTESGPVTTPEPCPQGYYCPPGTGAAMTNACPPGTFGDAEGYDELDDCVSCTAGWYCEEPALSTPTGECYAGFYCTGGAAVPTPYDDMVDSDNSSFTGNNVCPKGYYCTNGTDYPEPCPPGTFSVNTRVTQEEDCDPCPPGKYCNLEAFIRVNEAPDCDPGYVCTGGSTTGAPAQGSGMGYPCPAGHYCPSGVTVELGCPIGTYQPDEGQANCTICPDGLMCLYVNMTTPEPCKSGHYCVYGEQLPIPCPPGRFNNITGISAEEECAYCVSGQYCSGYGNVWPSGPCTAGYYCEGGAVDQVPTATSEFPNNGLCPVGHYCDEGTPAPEQCPAGTIRYTEGAAGVGDCLPCPGGYYCETPGKTNATGQCSAGYYCPANETITAPSPGAFRCPVGHYCPVGSPAPVPCGVGNYQPDVGRDSCIQCQAGYYCESSLYPDPTPCPAYHYCPAATRTPIPCPDGTFTYPNDTGLKSEYECLPCLSGQYCRGGQLQGACAQGYLCLSRSSEHTPNGTFPVFDVDKTQCEDNTTCAGPCPRSHYCPEGTPDPIPCANNTYRDEYFGSVEEDCYPCPPGSYCLEGDPTLYPCLLGHYCLQGQAPIECPLYHYRDVEGATSMQDCFNCEPGYFCNETGMTNTTFYPCPVGHYCEEATTEPVPCTGGRMSTTEGRVSNEDCPLCTPGYYCPNDTINVHGIPCRPTYECPEGASIEVTCRAGHYCEGVTGEPPICPGGYYCPIGSFTPTRCFYPKYCPEGSEFPLACPLGYRAVNHNELRDSDSDSCFVCPAGTYGNHTERFYCADCPEGYYCPEGTGNPQDYPCEKGYYCPANSSAPTPCPAGTYGNQALAVAASQCVDCPAGTYNNLEGQVACRPCGSASSSEPGSPTCTCTGAYRSFQISDGSCECQSGYVYYDETDQQQVEGNGEGDCQPRVDTRCELSQSRDASTRECVDPSTVDCTTQCGTNGGSWNVDVGRCECNTYTTVESICGNNCSQVIPTAMISVNANGALSLTCTDPSGNTMSKSISGSIGPSAFTSGAKRSQFAETSDTGATGIVPTSVEDCDSFTSDATTIQVTTASYYSTSDSYTTMNYSMGTQSSRRRLMAVQSTTGVSGIENPLFCLELEDMLLFRVTIDHSNRSLSNYPVYVKDHLFNTNPTFDYSEFRDLRFYVINTNVSITFFAHVFTEPGRYVFADAQEPSWEIIVAVQEQDVSCDAIQVAPSSTANLVEQDIGKQNNINEAPDWGLIIGMLAFLAACIVMLVAAVIVWRPKDAGIYPMKAWKPKYRALGAPPKIPAYLQYKDHDREELIAGSTVAGASGVALSGVASSQPTILEDFNVRTLYDKLEDQSLYLSQQLAKQQEDLQGFYERMSKQTDGLKDLLISLDTGKLERLSRAGRRRSSSSSSSSDDGSSSNVRIANYTSHRTFNFSGSSRREQELMEALQLLLEKLNSGKIPISQEMLQQAGLAPGGAAAGGVVSGKGAAVDKLLARQKAERISLDKELREEAENEMEKLLSDYESKRNTLTRQLSEDLQAQLDQATSKEEVSEILADHELRMADALDKLDKQKNNQMQDLTRRLAQKRRDREGALRKQHKAEAEEMGLKLEDIGETDPEGILQDQGLDLDMLSAEEAAARSKDMAKQNRNLAQEQQRMMSDNMNNTLTSLGDNGTISESDVSELKGELTDMEDRLARKIDKRKSDLSKNMKNKMAEKRRKKMKKLQEKHDKELEKANSSEEAEEIELRHQKRMEAMEKWLDAEENGLAQAIEKEMGNEMARELKEGHRELLEKLSESNDLDQVTRQRLMGQLRRDNENIDYELSVQRDQQSSNMNAKLAARRNKRKQDMQRVAEEAAAQRILKEQEKSVGKEPGDAGGFSIMGVAEDTPINMAELSMEEQAVVREHQRVQEEMKQRHQEEKEDLAKKVAEDAKTKEEGEVRRLEREKSKVLSETRNKHAAELAARQDLSEEEMKQLLLTHARELEDIEDRLESERTRQQLSLRDRLAERKKRLLEDQKRKQGLELAKESIEQKKELREVHGKVVKEAERKEMVEGIQQAGSQNTDKVIKEVLAKRQAQEARDLDAQFAAERQVAVEGALAKLHDKYNARRDSMLQRHEKELADLAKEDLTAEQRQQRRAALLNKQQIELNKLERELAEEKKGIEKGALSDWELRYARAKLELKERHYQEYADALRELSSEQDANQVVNAEQAAKAAQELEEVRQKLEKERLANEERLKKEREDFEGEEKKKMEKELADYERKLMEEEKKDREKNDKRITALNKRREDMIKDKKKKQEEKLAALRDQGASKEDQEKLIAEFEKDMAKVQNQMDADRMRMQSELEERIRKRKEERRKAKTEQVQATAEENIREKEEELKSEEERMKAEEVILLRNSVESEYLLSDAPAQQSQAFPADYAMAAALSDKDLANLLMASPLYRKLEEIKRTMQDGTLPQRKRGEEIFLDKSDAEWTKDDKLVPVDLNTLSPRSFVAYRFGCFVVRLVATHCGHDPVSLLVAKKIPVNEKLVRNAYRNSFHYDDLNRVLYVRQERLSSVGEFMLVLIHALAHIKAGDMRDDTNVDFMREFHLALSVVCNDLFFARYRSKNAPKGADGDQDAANGAGTTTTSTSSTVEEPALDPSQSQALLQAMFGTEQLETEKEDAVERLLDVKLLHGTDGDGVHFNKEILKERLSSYSNFSLNDKMRHFLGHVEDKVALARQHGSHDDVDKRLTKMTGTAFTSKAHPSVSPMKGAVEQLPDELSGTALWQSVAKESSAKQSQGGRIKLAASKAKDKDLQKHFLQDEVKSLEEKLDRMNATFSELSTEYVKTQEGISALYEELNSQKTLVEEEKSEEKEKLMMDTTKLLSDAQNNLTDLRMKRETLSQKITSYTQLLEERQQQLQTILRRKDKK